MSPLWGCLANVSMPMCVCMWVSPAWVLGLCKVAKSASVPLNQVWQWIVVMFPGVCMILAQWQPSFHTVERWFSCMWHGCINETLLHCTSLHECAVTRGTLSNGPAAIPAGPPTARPISGYCLGQPWVQRPPGQTLLPFSQYCPPPPFTSAQFRSALPLLYSFQNIFLMCRTRLLSITK